MAAVELILLQRVEKLGQMGEVVKVKPGFARNFLLPQKKAIRASKDNLARFEKERAQLEAQNLKRREEAERIAERVAGLAVVVIRQAGEGGSLYGSVSARDIADAATEAGLSIGRQQVVLEHPIKSLGLTPVRVLLHPGGRDHRHRERRPQPRGGRAPGPRRADRGGGGREPPAPRPCSRSAPVRRKAPPDPFPSRECDEKAPVRLADRRFPF